MNPVDFFEQKIVRPYIYNAFFMAFKYGLLLEPHPQNVLIELDENFNGAILRSCWHITNLLLANT